MSPTSTDGSSSVGTVGTVDTPDNPVASKGVRLCSQDEWDHLSKIYSVATQVSLTEEIKPAVVFPVTVWFDPAKPPSGFKTQPLTPSKL